MDKPSRNDLCPCGSGKKYKACCWEIDQQRAAVLATDRERFEQAAAQAMDRAVELLEAEDDSPLEDELEGALETLGGLLELGGPLDTARFDERAFDGLASAWMDEYESNLEPDSPEPGADPERDAEVTERMLAAVLPKLATTQEIRRFSRYFGDAILDPDLEPEERVAVAVAYLTIDPQVPSEASLGLREIYFAHLDDWAQDEEEYEEPQ